MNVNKTDSSAEIVKFVSFDNLFDSHFLATRLQDGVDRAPPAYTAILFQFVDSSANITFIIFIFWFAVRLYRASTFLIFDAPFWPTTIHNILSAFSENGFVLVSVLTAE